MAEGPSQYLVQKWLDATFNATSFSVAQAYLQLHVGVPGAAGTANVATGASGSDRKSVSFAAAPAAVGGVVTISNDVQVQWTLLSNPQDATYYTLWDAATSGNFLGSGAVTANAWVGGDSLTFAIGDIDIALNCAT